MNHALIVFFIILVIESNIVALKIVKSTHVKPVGRSMSQKSPLLALRAGSINSVLDAYNEKLERNPWTTKIITSGAINLFGDVVAQLINLKGTAGKFDIRRCVIFTAMGAVYIAPVINLWMNWINSLPYPEALSNTKAKKALSMLALDQTLGAVAVNGGFLFVFELVSTYYRRFLFKNVVRG